MNESILCVTATLVQVPRKHNQAFAAESDRAPDGRQLAGWLCRLRHAQPHLGTSSLVLPQSNGQLLFPFHSAPQKTDKPLANGNHHLSNILITPQDTLLNKTAATTMSDSSGSARSTRFMRGAGQVNDPEGKLWAPARWVVQLVQYLIAIIMLTIGEGFKAIFSGQSPQHRRRKEH